LLLWRSGKNREIPQRNSGLDLGALTTGARLTYHDAV
jgi:hypothetical protein